MTGNEPVCFRREQHSGSHFPAGLLNKRDANVLSLPDPVYQERCRIVFYWSEQHPGRRGPV